MMGSLFDEIFLMSAFASWKRGWVKTLPGVVVVRRCLTTLWMSVNPSTSSPFDKLRVTTCLRQAGLPAVGTDNGEDF